MSADCGVDIPVLVEELIDKEVGQEKRVSYLDADICAKIKDISHEQLVYISDFYLPSHKLNEILEANYCPISFNRHFVSFEAGLNKRSSRLFGKVHDELGIEPGEHLHLGDNPVADVQAPQRRGIAGTLFHHDAEEKKRIRLRQAFESRGEGLSAYLTEMLAKARKQSIAEERTGSALALYHIGQELAPLMLSFVLCVIDQAVLNRADKVFYCTREGEFFRTIHQVLAQHDLFGLPMPEDEIIEVSRLSTFGPSLRQFDTDELMRICSLYSSQSLSALITSLGLEPSPFTAKMREHGIDPDQPIEYPWQDPPVQNLFNDETFREGVETQLEADRQKLHLYLKQKGFAANNNKVFIVDIGWRGTIQDNLAHLSEEVKIHGTYNSRVLHSERGNWKLRRDAKESNGSEQRIAEQERKLKERWEAMQEMESMIQERDWTIAEQGRTLEERWNAMQEIERMIGERDRTIAELRQHKNETVPESVACIPEMKGNE